MSTAEEFILIPENQFMKEQLYSPQILNDPSVQHTGAHFSFLNHMPSNENTKKEYRKFWIQGKQLIPLSCQKKLQTTFFKILTC